MELSQRCVLRDERSVVVLDEGGVACESSPDWERTWVAWEEVDRIHGRSNHSTTYRNYYRPSPEEMRGALGTYFSWLGNSMGEDSAEGTLPTD